MAITYRGKISFRILRSLLNLVKLSTNIITQEQQSLIKLDRKM